MARASKRLTIILLFHSKVSPKSQKASPKNDHFSRWVTGLIVEIPTILNKCHLTTTYKKEFLFLLSVEVNIKSIKFVKSWVP